MVHKNQEHFRKEFTVHESGDFSGAGAIPHVIDSVNFFNLEQSFSHLRKNKTEDIQHFGVIYFVEQSLRPDHTVIPVTTENELPSSFCIEFASNIFAYHTC